MMAGKSSSITFSIGAPKKIGVNSKLQMTITQVILKAPQIKPTTAERFCFCTLINKSGNKSKSTCS